MKEVNEIWKKIEEFETYSVSNLGRVRNDKTNHIMIGGHDKDGYRQVTISYGGKQYNRRVCRLVAIAFVENPNNYAFVNHKDENRGNDVADNLEWCTVRYNNIYGNRMRNSSRRIRCVETGKDYPSTREVERQLGFCHTNIGLAARTGRMSYGFHREYV